MMLTVNGSRRDVPDGTTLHTLVRDDLGLRSGGAAAVDGAVVPKSKWAVEVLTDGQDIEILTAVQGG